MNQPIISARSVWIGFARIQHVLGWAGVVGLFLAAGAATTLSMAWRDQRSYVATTARLTAARAQSLPKDERAVHSGVSASSHQALASMSELPAQLTRLKTISIGNGLGWAAAEYRLLPASDSAPASMEVRTQFTGTYPQIRRMLTQVIDRVPGATFRQLSFARATSDAGDIETKVVFAILLEDGPLSPSGRESTPARGSQSQGGSR